MKNTIRGCISCILPCGALDVIRIVHCNGRVEEISGTVRASEIMKAYPKHVLKKPSSYSCSEDGVAPKIVIVPPDAELQRGKIYFLMPVPPPKAQEKNVSARSNSSACTKTSSSTRKKRREHGESNNHHHQRNAISMTSLLASDDQYLSEILSEKSIPTQRDRGRGRVTVWRPHLASISESPTDVCSDS